MVGRLGAGRALNVVVAGKVGVPANATGVIANVTAVEPCDSGFLTVYPAGSPPPLASSTNYRTGDVVAALVTVRLGTGGAISVYTHVQTDVVVDVVGYFHANQGTLYNAVDPFRLVDTRPTGVGSGQELGAHPWRRHHPRGPRRHRRDPQPHRHRAGRAAASSRCTPAPATLPTDPGVEPQLRQGPDVANLVVAALGADGSVCVYSNVSSQVVVDAAGWLAGDGTGMFGVTPQR